ncbi:MAG: hypothetical protein ACLP8Y_06810 [Thermoplasmata archaeon]
MVVPAAPTRQPVSVQREARLAAFFVGYGMVAFAIGLAFFGGAGVVTSPTNFYSGPTPLSLALLFATIGILIAGAVVVAGFGSMLGNASEPESGARSAKLSGARLSIGRIAVFLVILGVGLLLIGLSLPLVPWCMSAALVPCYISPNVVFVPQTLDGVGLGALALGIAFFARGRMSSPSEFRAWWRRTGRYVTVVGVAVFLVTTALLVVPVRQSFSTQLRIEGGNIGGITDEVFPTGTIVTGSWSASPEGLVSFTIQGGSSGGNIYTANASSGSFSFTTTGNPWALYLFLGQSPSPETVTVSGSYIAPLWSWPPGEPTAFVMGELAAHVR